MTTARILIKKAFQKAGIITKQESPSSDEAEDALDTLNGLLGSWSNDSLYIVGRTLESFNFVAGQATYTIGSSGNFNTTRPIDIVEIYFRTGDVDYPLYELSDSGYAETSFKALQGFPEYYNYTNEYPLGKINVYPTPSSAYEVFILSEKQLTSYADLDDNIDLPPGWERALIYNLAVELLPEYGQPLTPEMSMVAENAKAAIKRAVSKNRNFDATPSGRADNIYTGWYSR